MIVDVVPNHTSDRHRWFREALAAAPGSAARERYVFRRGRGRDGELPPNDWESVFGGPAWTRVTEADGAAGEWYLHLFDPSPARPRLGVTPRCAPSSRRSCGSGSTAASTASASTWRTA